MLIHCSPRRCHSSQLEIQVLDRVPRLSAPIVIYDDDGRLTPRAADTLSDLGYEDISVLEGGLQGWRQAGQELFQDVNSASKAFGELVEARRHTPSLSPEEVKQQIDAGGNVVVLDVRKLEEYRTMSIPTAVSVPGAELVLRAAGIAPDSETLIIVNCAGRTRSIIGTQSLINAGFGGRAVALRNGTIGWTLAGLALDHGAERRYGALQTSEVGEARGKARDVAYRAGVRWIDPEALTALRNDSTRTTYFFDVRPPSEYSEGHVVGFRNAPGGQLVQETDVAAPVRGARIVLHDILGARADMTASWLAQMNWDVYVLDADDMPLEAKGPNQPTLRGAARAQTDFGRVACGEPCSRDGRSDRYESEPAPLGGAYSRKPFRNSVPTCLCDRQAGTAKIGRPLFHRRYSGGVCCTRSRTHDAF